MIIAQNSTENTIENEIRVIRQKLEGLEKKNEELRKENEELRKENGSLQSRLQEQENLVAWFQKQIFGKKSERRVPKDSPYQLYFPGFEPKGEKDQEVTVNAHIKKVRKKEVNPKISFPEDLPVERRVIDIPEDKKICPETGLPLVKIGEEVSQKLAHRPGEYFIKEIVRPKYAKPTDADPSIIICDMPDSILPKCKIDESLLAEILTRKYVDHLPLNRISEMLKRYKIIINRKQLSEWVIKAGIALEPLYNVMHQKILDSGVVFMDETPVNLQDKGKKKMHKAYMWILAGGRSRDPPYRIYGFRRNRQHCHAGDLLRDFTGVLHSDKYGAYESLANREDIIWCPCFAHIRRKFVEMEHGDLTFRDWVIDKLRNLFAIEKLAWELSPEERLDLRQNKAVPVLDKLTAIIEEKSCDASILPKSSFKKALSYFMGLRSHLKNYTQHPFAHLDNNVAERAVRPLALGRKNWLFFGSERGGKASAILFSLIQTCRALEINPREYLEDVCRKFMSYPFNKVEDLLPDNWSRLF